MATATTPPPSRSRDEAQRKVVSPLQRLRGYIRFYVSAEGVAVLFLYLALWFWIGLLLDYGFFKATGVDWVQVLSHGFRAGVLLVLVAGLLAVVAVKVLFRLLREFRDPALALVLERRFPHLLGDRLITAVELADPKKAEKYGYSQPMIDHTVQDAAGRVDQVPVGDVFNWKRLTRAFVLVAIVTLGIYFAVGAAFCAYQGLKSAAAAEKSRREGPADFAAHFGDVSAIWFERNILLYDTIWPRRAHLELLDFPGDERKVGRDAPPPALRVRAVKWLIADSDRKQAPEGWRPLLWEDVHRLQTGLTVPEVPDSLRPARWRGTVDEVDLQLAREEVRQQLAARDLIAVLDQLEELANLPQMSRKLRKLQVPDEVYVLYKGATSSNEQTLKKQGDNEYAGTLAELKESIRFTVRGEDYYTPYRRITVVPPPEVTELTRDELQPAYLYYRLAKGVEPGELRGKKQQLRDVPVSLTGDASRFDVPAGTDVLLKARTDKALQTPGGVRVKPRPGSAPVAAPVEQLDAHAFQVRFPNVKAAIDLVFELTDTDDVHGARHVIINPVEDLTPEVDVLVEVIRKTNQGYLISPSALVPFSGKVRDDHGLTRVEYQYAVTKIEAGPNPRAKAAVVAAAVPLALGDLSRLSALALLGTLRRPAGEGEGAAELAPLTTFDRALKDREAFETSLPKLRDGLGGAPPARTEVDRALIKEHLLEPESEFFDVAKLGLKVADEKSIQPHYRLRLGMVATDNDVETGPHQGLSKEKFNLFVVSENELLAEIAKEEEGLHIKLEEMVNRLKEARVRLERVIQELEDPKLRPEEFAPLARRTEEVGETVTKGGDVTREVFGDYSRILRELQANRVQKAIIDRVNDKIVEPLDLARRDDFPRADESLREAQKSIDAKNRDPKAAKVALDNLQTLLDRLGNVLDAMADITTINNLIAKFVELERSEAQEMKRLQDLKQDLEKKILEDLIKK